MFYQSLPQGKEAALIHGASFNVPGIFLYAKLVYLFMDMVEEKFGFKIPIKYMYGSPQLRWNGGRLILNEYNNIYSLHKIEKEILEAVKRGITPLITMSNTSLSQADLRDKKSNEVLNIVREYNAGVIISNDLLYEYIREHYPTVSIHASVVKTACLSNRDYSYYSSLSEKYSYFVVNPDDNFNIKLLKGLNKSNAEIIVNERCYYNCPLRLLHYNSISEEQITLTEGKYRKKNFLENCKAIPEYKQSYSKNRNISLTVTEMKKLYNLGYTIFKLQGRTDEVHLFFFDLMRYTLENEISFPHMYAVFSHHIDNFIRGD